MADLFWASQIPAQPQPSPAQPSPAQPSPAQPCHKLEIKSNIWDYRSNFCFFVFAFAQKKQEQEDKGFPVCFFTRRRFPSKNMWQIFEDSRRGNPLFVQKQPPGILLPLVLAVLSKSKSENFFGPGILEDVPHIFEGFPTRAISNPEP